MVATMKLLVVCSALMASFMSSSRVVRSQNGVVLHLRRAGSMANLDARSLCRTHAEIAGENSKTQGRQKVKSEAKPKPRPRGRPRGLKVSEDTKKKIAAARRGKKWDKETRKKMSESKAGRAHLPSTIERMSEAQRGKRLANSTKAKIAQARRGLVHAPEVKERIRQSVRHTKRKKKLMELRISTDEDVSEDDEENTPIDQIRNLREQMEPWIQQFKEVHGVMPTLENTKVLFPTLHDSMKRYQQLLKLLKNKDGNSQM